jgi:nucleotide-binding universal stress UspA family protein
MERKILVPLDGSVLAEQALPCATMLARGLAAQMVLLRAIALPSDVAEFLADAAMEAEAPLQHIIGEAEAYLAETANRIKQAGIDIDWTVRRGPAAESIVDLAEAEGIQFIVMATHGYSGITRWRHGSVAERVLQSASVPVLMLRADDGRAAEPAHIPVCEHILVPLDGSAVAEQALAPAAEVGEALGARITLFRVPIVSVSSSLMGDWYLPLEGVFASAEKDAEDYLQNIAERLQAEGLRVGTAIEIGGVAEAIIGFAEASNVDMIAMCTHGRTGLARWALGSVADRVLRASDKPLLLVRAHQDGD